jgi:hypothetical protein
MGRHVGMADMERHVGTANMERHVGVADMGRHVGTADVEKHVVRGATNSTDVLRKPIGATGLDMPVTYMERHPAGMDSPGTDMDRMDKRSIAVTDMERHVAGMDIRATDMDRRFMGVAGMERQTANVEGCVAQDNTQPSLSRAAGCFGCQEQGPNTNLGPRNILHDNGLVQFDSNFRGYGNVVGSAGPTEGWSTVSRTPGGSLKSAGKKIKDPKLFDGSFGKWADYAKYWHRLVRWNEWTEDVALEALHLSLSGDAATYITGLSNSDSMSYMELLAALEDRFGPARTISEDKRMLRSRKKQPGETFEHLAHDIRALAKRVFRNVAPLVEEESRDAFIKALPDNLRLPVAASNPKTLDECLDNVTHMCSLMDSTECNYAVAMRNPNESQSQVFNTRLENVECFRCRRKGHTVSSCQNPVTCYNCEESGHVMKLCPYNRRERNDKGRPFGPKILRFAEGVKEGSAQGS